MDRNLERNVDYARDGIDALVAEIVRLEQEVGSLQDIISTKETEIENLEEIVEELKERINKIFNSKIFWLFVSPYIMEIILVLLGWVFISFLKWELFPLGLEISFEKIRVLFILNMFMTFLLAIIFEY